jgi:prevent-host-death family protein
MGPVNLKKARQYLSDLVRAAEHGQTVTITRRGKPVARLVPPETQSVHKTAPDLTEFRASMKVKGKPMSQGVIDMRREARY